MGDCSVHSGTVSFSSFEQIKAKLVRQETGEFQAIGVSYQVA